MSTLPSVIVGLVYHIPFADAFFGSVVAGTFHDPFHRPLCIVLSRGGGRGSAAMANVQRSVVGALLLALLPLLWWRLLLWRWRARRTARRRARRTARRRRPERAVTDR